MIETLLSSALNDSKISHEEFTNVITEKKLYENIKENIRDTSSVKWGLLTRSRSGFFKFSTTLKLLKNH